MNEDKVTVIVPAAGKGIRMNHSLPKQFLPIGGKPILAHTLLNLNRIPDVDSIIVVVNEGRIRWCREKVVNRFGIEKVKKVIKGGSTRQQSVSNGLKSLEESTRIVVIHDGARPFITVDILRRVVDKAKRYGAAICAIPVQDTLKKVADNTQVESTSNRNSLWLVQTPQAFLSSLLLKAYEKALTDGYEGTDDSAVVERLPHPVKIVEGSPLNIKVTTPQDLILAEAILERGEW
ncbi:MAG TPA: 2-C-methyl-D-erythritol 4-phosphate cytidylyltransferase [Candidatus Omnitrophica bacterium]|nr:2-C-methyl-D-erythritol 4-phosphate cytidylyltransferase [Candidatus Omnitrophota bacterium]